MSEEARRNPYVGLRPYQADEDYLFFGCEELTDELLRRLRLNRFMAVVGPSGSGKSSLVRAGMIPALYGGYMTGAGSDWRIAVMRPGNDPIGNLAKALMTPGVLLPEEAEPDDLDVDVAQASLRRSERGLVHAVAEARLPKQANLLVLVDQFEELFRYRQERTEGDTDPALAFVRLLLEASAQDKHTVYVVITMRSDFLGDCTQFHGLPETINQGQYLIPRMNRRQLREAITGPAGVGGTSLETPLVQRLLNDVADDPDQLPILQHALLRTFEHWLGRGAEGTITLEDYHAIGGMERALDMHAEEAYAELPAATQPVAEKVFQCLTETGRDGRGVRRPTPFEDLCGVTGGSEEEVGRVIDCFREPGRAFLFASSGKELLPRSMIDISHESLMRVWKRLRTWVEREGRTVGVYRRLLDTARLHAEGKEELLRGAALEVAVDLRDGYRPTSAWADRYGGDFDLSMAFLEGSLERREQERAEEEAAQRRELERAKELLEAQRKQAEADRQLIGVQERSRRRLKRFSVVLAVAMVAAVASAIWAVQLKGVAEEQRNVAEEAQRAAEEARRVAEERRIEAVRVAARQFAEKGLALGEEGDSAHGLLWLSRALRDASADQIDDFATALRRHIGSWVGQHHQLAARLPHGEGLRVVAIDPTGRRVLSAGHAAGVGEDEEKGKDPKPQLWDRESGKAIELAGRHTQRIRAATFSPDGEFVVTGSEDGTAVIWDAATGDFVASLGGHAGGVSSVDVSPSSNLISTGGDDGGLRIWRRDGVREATVGAASKGSIGVAFCGSEFEVAVVGISYSWKAALAGPEPGKGPEPAKGPIRIWNWKTARVTETLLPELDASIYSIDAKGQWVLVGTNLSRAKLWRRRGGGRAGAVERDFMHLGDVDVVRFSADAETVLTGSEDQTVRLWERATGRPIGPILTHQEAVVSADLSADGRYVVVAPTDRKDEEEVMVWRVAPGNDRVLRHPKAVQDLAFRPDDAVLLTGANDGVARLWSVAEGNELDKLQGHKERILHVAFDPRGRNILTGAFWGSDDSAARIWHSPDYDRGIELFHPGGVQAIGFVPDGSRCITGSYRGFSRVWDAATGEQLTPKRNWSEQARNYPDTQGVLGHDGFIKCVAVSPDGKVLVTGGEDREARLWSLEDWSSLGSLPHGNYVNTAVFSGDGNLLVTASDDDTVRVWDMKTKQVAWEKKQNHGVTVAVFDSTATRVATGCWDNIARVWDVGSGDLVGAPLEHQAKVNSVRFSPDDKLLLTASDDHTSRLWDVGTGLPVAAPIAHVGNANMAAFSHDGRTAASAGEDGDVRVVRTPLPVAGSVERIELWLQVITGLQFGDDGSIRFVTPDEWKSYTDRLEELGGAPPASE